MEAYRQQIISTGCFKHIRWGCSLVLLVGCGHQKKIANVQILLGGPDQALSDTRVSDKVRWVRAGLQQLGLCLVRAAWVRSV